MYNYLIKLSHIIIESLWPWRLILSYFKYIYVSFFTLRITVQYYRVLCLLGTKFKIYKNINNFNYLCMQHYWNEMKMLNCTLYCSQIFSMAWSPCGRYLATMCRDSHIRVYDPRKSTEPIREGNGPVGVRGARVLWALDGKFIVTVGFSK